jgi:tryptophan synthase beta subunit
VSVQGMHLPLYMSVCAALELSCFVFEGIVDVRRHTAQLTQQHLMLAA